MPELSRFFGIVIRMYFDDHNPPHFHAYYSGHEAQFAIDPIGLLEGELPTRAVSLIVEWAALHQQELTVNWERVHNGEGVKKIDPLV